MAPRASLPIAIGIIALLAFAGCASPSAFHNWSKVELGMTKARVIQLLGQPDIIESRQQIYDEDKPDGTALTIEYAN